MADAFQHHAAALDSPAEYHAVITASATALDPKPRAIRCNAAGTLTMTDKAGTSVSYTVAAGDILPFRGVAVTACPANTVAWW